MKNITKTRLQEIIKEEINSVLEEQAAIRATTPGPIEQHEKAIAKAQKRLKQLKDWQNVQKEIPSTDDSALSPEKLQQLDRKIKSQEQLISILQKEIQKEKSKQTAPAGPGAPAAAATPAKAAPAKATPTKAAGSYRAATVDARKRYREMLKTCRTLKGADRKNCLKTQKAIYRAEMTGYRKAHGKKRRSGGIRGGKPRFLRRYKKREWDIGNERADFDKFYRSIKRDLDPSFVRKFKFDYTYGPSHEKAYQALQGKEIRGVNVGPFGE